MAWCVQGHNIRQTFPHPLFVWAPPVKTGVRSVVRDDKNHRIRIVFYEVGDGLEEQFVHARGLVGGKGHLLFDIGRGLCRSGLRGTEHVRKPLVDLLTVRPKDEREMRYRQVCQHKARLSEGARSWFLWPRRSIAARASIARPRNSNQQRR